MKRSKLKKSCVTRKLFGFVMQDEEFLEVIPIVDAAGEIESAKVTSGPAPIHGVGIGNGYVKTNLLSQEQRFHPSKN